MELLNTELDAINLCLSGIGREPVATLETTDLDSAMARDTLNQVGVDIQNNGGRGWWFNHEKGWKLAPDGNGEIILPNNTLSILEARATFYDQGNRLTVRGNKVYDTDQHTFDMTDNVNKEGVIEFSLLLLLQYESLPTTARSAIAWSARRIFVDDVLGDVNMHKINSRNEQEAYFRLEQENRKTLRSNYLLDNQKVRYQLGRIGGYNNLYR